MKLFLFLVGIASVWALHGEQSHICEEVNENGVLISKCCEGWTGYEDGCDTPVCSEACTLQGGTCISPNTCRCPGGEIAQNCSRSKCEHERHTHERLSWAERRRTFKPTCLPDGSYTILQCNEVNGGCFCADRWTGEMIVSTFTRGVPDCEEYYVERKVKHLFRPKEVVPFHHSNGQDNTEVAQNTEEEEEITTPPCALKHKEWRESTILSFFRSEPQCTEDGYFVSHRCDFFMGYCVCLDRNTGVDIESTKVHSINIDCSEASLPEPEPEPTSNAPAVFPEEGCVVGTTYHSPGERFFRDCNMCSCHGFNVIQCTDRTCEPDACYFGETGKIIEHVMNGECRRCTCENGVTACSVVDCNELDTVEEAEDLETCGGKRPVGSYFYDECNTCSCSGTVAACTLMGCLPEGCTFEDWSPSNCAGSGSCWVDRRSMNNGQELSFGCDTLRCVDGQVEVVESCVEYIDHEMKFSGSNPEDACFYNDRKFFNGESMLYGFKICKCRNFDWDCQPISNPTMQ
ncbi:hypothetical protein HOLleu_18399 [Holothuria leucospilota]|uniref:Thyroglobulin type-1 domain-containing protein n=1 Tax=Holothuria leucospilota TaxID=206669 RepID=A0A9Q1H6N4_HOLLE|nr:hypothetical protein HOLleu_18399 [Holothuria leucospilota]